MTQRDITTELITSEITDLLYGTTRSRQIAVDYNSQSIGVIKSMRD